MYARKEPRFEKVHRQTPEGIGPTTYFLPEIYDGLKQNDVPFLTKEKRGGFLVNRNAASIPAPNVYTPMRPCKHIKGGNALKYSSTRFWYDGSKEGMPAPPDYDPHPDKPVSSARKGQSRSKGKIYHCTTPFTLIGKGSSVPSLRDSNGYKDCCGILVKVPPNDFDQTLGPAFYHPPMEAGSMYKGNFWGRMKGKRGFFSAKLGPGPTDYDIEPEPTPSHLYDEKLREFKRNNTTVLRYTEEVEKNCRRENIPAPNHYTFPLVKERKGKRRQHGAFLRSSERFQSNISDYPGPSDTVDPRNAMDKLNKPGSLSGVPFMSTVPRTKREKKMICPGPATYTLPDLTKESACKLPSIYSLVRTPFKCSEPRVFTYMAHDKTIPRPTDYDVKDDLVHSQSGGGKFSSTVLRFPDPSNEILANCATYDVRPELTRLYQSVSHQKPSSRRATPFSTKDRRFGAIYGVPKVDPANPSPCAYTPKTAPRTCVLPVGSFATVARFPDPYFITPGPGKYKLHPMINDTCLKGTFNDSLHNPIPRFRAGRKLPFTMRVATPKKLLCFDSDPAARRRRTRQMRIIEEPIGEIP